jgi:hypothetical protein
MPKPNFTPLRKSVLQTVDDSTATAEQPLSLRGQEFSAAMWLWQQGLINRTGGMFYPKQTKDCI